MNSFGGVLFKVITKTYDVITVFDEIGISVSWSLVLSHFDWLFVFYLFISV
jgi:hypothetical protein